MAGELYSPTVAGRSSSENLIRPNGPAINAVSFAFKAQEIVLSDAISDCSGAVNIINPGSFELQFSGKGGVVEDLSAYPSLKSIPEKNSIWCSYKAPYKGRFTLEANSDKVNCSDVARK